MMKRVLLIIVILFIIMGDCFAAPPAGEVSGLNDKFQDAKYRIESGINYRDFSNMASDLYVASRKFADKYPGEQVAKEFIKVSDLYKIGKTYWEKAIYKKYVPLMMYEKLDVITFYPDIAKKVNLYNGEWYPEFARDAVISGIPAYQDALNKFIKEQYPQ